MGKPGLGRGLGGLMSPPGIRAGGDSPADGRAQGVQLLLRGENGHPIAPPPPPPTSAPAPNPATFPSWAFGVLIVADALLIALGIWIAFASRGTGHLLVATIPILLGGGLLALGVWLRGDRAAAELESLNPLETPPPRVRVRFLDER